VLHHLLSVLVLKDDVGGHLRSLAWGWVLSDALRRTTDPALWWCRKVLNRLWGYI
jgi:hypothetical protein